MANRKGNPNWGKGVNTAPLPIRETWFDRKVRELGLSENEFANSVALKRWVAQFGGSHYVPEWLLRSYGFEIIESSEGGYLGVSLVKQRDHMRIRVGRHFRCVAGITKK